jgi:hypothetical protein
MNAAQSRNGEAKSRKAVAGLAYSTRFETPQYTLKIGALRCYPYPGDWTSAFAYDSSSYARELEKSSGILTTMSYSRTGEITLLDKKQSGLIFPNDRGKLRLKPFSQSCLLIAYPCLVFVHGCISGVEFEFPLSTRLS